MAVDEQYAQVLRENRELRALLREARAALEPLTGAQIKLHRIKLDLADRIDATLDGVSALPTPKLCPGCAQYHGRNDCPVGWLAPAETYGVPASEYLAKIKADPRRAAALQRARDRAAGVQEVPRG